jgi:hypothetical protein
MSNKYEILPVKIDKKKHEKWADVDEMLPIHPFAVLCCAPPKSGKSVLTVNALLNPSFDWINRFDRVVIISPTIMSDKSWAPIHKVIDHEIEDNPYSDKVKIFTGDDLDHMDEIIDAIVEEQKSDPTITSLIIIDDAIGRLRNGSLGKIYAKYRHFNLSLLTISQAFKSFDPISRCSCNGYVLFKTHNMKERQKIVEEMNGIPNFEKMYDEVTDKKHSFLWVNLEKQAVYDNFNKKIYSKD